VHYAVARLERPSACLQSDRLAPGLDHHRTPASGDKLADGGGNLVNSAGRIGAVVILDEVLAHRLAEVRERIARAAERERRNPDDITLIAVTKKFPTSVMIEAYNAGLRDFGENYVQEFDTKFGEVAGLSGAHFRLIGHLQSNKSRRAAEIFSAIDTIDSVKLARRLDEQATKPLDVLIEVKLSDEDAKHGAAPEEIGDIAAALREARNLRLIGLMTMPPWSEDAELSRPYFRRLRELAERHGLRGLSMGMSHDLETGIEEGATMVRVGTALFGRRPKP
jgi:PLP dependent protein